MQYYAKLTQEDGQWLVEFPDCPGCQTFGATKLEALAMAQEALEGWLETSLLHGDVPPRPVPRRGSPVWVRPRLEVAIQIRWLRDELKMTQTQLAKLAGVSQQQIAKLENPDANPTIGTLEALAQHAKARLTVSFAREKPAKSRAGN